MPDFLIADELISKELVEVDFVGGNKYRFTPQLVSTHERPLGRAGRLFTDFIIEEFAEYERQQQAGIGFSGLG